MTSHTSAMTDGADFGLPSAHFRKLFFCAVIAVVVLSPARHLLSGHMTAGDWFRLAGAVALAVLGCWVVLSAPPAGALRWTGALAFASLAVALFAVGGVNWVGLLAVAAGLAGRYYRARLLAALGVLSCGVAGLVVASVKHYPFGSTVSVVALPLLAGLAGYVTMGRVDALDALRRTRAELARAAAAEERLRIARDLHDLLGHSLSLISLKAELADRVLSADPDRAAREIAELRAVARQSLSDVRAAIAGYRQPDLAAELAAARQLLDAAGMSSSITLPAAVSLSPDVDAALAWAVREGTTNAVRHSRATNVAITVTPGPSAVVAEIRDNGAGAGQRAAVTGAGAAGSGLTGLAERVRQLGGELTAGATEPHGFLLRVVVPLSCEAS